jgi:hypothetical protein
MLLHSFNRKSFTFAVVAALATVSLQTPPTPAQAREHGPFARFAGTWSGDGTITMSNGTRERIRCRVRYSVVGAGTGLTQDLVCASQSYKFDVSSQVRAAGSQLTGSWTETSRNVTGSVSGHVRDGVIQATVMGAAFSAGLSLSIHGRSQYVIIRPQGGTDVADVSVVLRRS